MEPDSQLVGVLGMEGVRDWMLGELSPLALLRLRRVCRATRDWAEQALHDAVVLVLVGSTCTSPQATAVLDAVRQRNLARAALLGDAPPGGGSALLLGGGEEEEEDGGDDDDDSGEDYIIDGSSDEESEEDSEEGSEAGSGDDGGQNGEPGDGAAASHIYATSSDTDVKDTGSQLVFSFDWRSGRWQPEAPLAIGAQAPVCGHVDHHRHSRMAGAAGAGCGAVPGLGRAAFVFDGVSGNLQQLEIACLDGPSSHSLGPQEACIRNYQLIK